MCVLTKDAVGGSQNIIAFIDTIPVSELGQAIIDGSDDGYNVLVGSTPTHINTFSTYLRHPHILVGIKDKNGNPVMGQNGKPLQSTAAGRTQILGWIADAYIKSLKLPDFGKLSQDRITLQMLRETGADKLLKLGKFTEAVFVASARWASFPGSNAGQHINKMELLQAAYTKAGGLMVEG